jgi:hypothetical protein
VGKPSKAEVGRVSTKYRSVAAEPSLIIGPAWDGFLSVEVHPEDVLPLSMRIRSTAENGMSIVMCMNEDETLALIGHLLRGRALVRDAKEEAGAV